MSTCVTDVKTVEVKKESGGQESSSNNLEEEEEKYDPNLDLETDFPQGKHWGSRLMDHS